MFKIEKIIFGLGFNQEEEEEEGMLNLILRLKPEPDDDFFFSILTLMRGDDALWIWW